MAASLPKGLGQPKLRTSCDQCGAAKVKCDRGQPECGRCDSHGKICVYGVLRKMGKPPRVNRSGLGRTPVDQPGAGAEAGARTGTDIADVRQLDSSSWSSDGIIGTFDPLSTITDVLAAWHAKNKNANCTGQDALGGLLNDINGQLIPNSPSFNLDEWAFTDYFNNHLSSNSQLGPLPTPESTDWGGCPSTETSTAQPAAYQSPSDPNLHSDRTEIPTVGISGHDCPREAYDILRNLSFLNPNRIQPTPSSGSTPSSATNNVDNQVPLDDVLRVNSEASERLGALLCCPCAQSPHLAILYASIISRVLLWYQQAAGSTQSVSCSHTAPDCSPTMGGSENNTSAAAPSTIGMALMPAKMAIGSFTIDDLHIQTALKIQLLSGEMRRAGRLIDQFMSLNSGGQFQTDNSNFSSIGGLYESLHSWLRGEHSRIANIIRLKLRELNT
ncbi:hypothetical protein BKA56DRAFT_714528 [Ilyonectria sp. MPI-CAGE-AT-0026]|nr:hypothetical protein BKA56DRAFT_714528 [Ilyonectria sp. MPI-CAGE-AT-0026]